MTTPPPATPLAPAVLDVEASGFGRSSYPIEIGVVFPDGHAYCTLIRPESHWTPVPRPPTISPAPYCWTEANRCMK